MGAIIVNSSTREISVKAATHARSLAPTGIRKDQLRQARFVPLNKFQFVVCVMPLTSPNWFAITAGMVSPEPNSLAVMHRSRRSSHRQHSSSDHLPPCCSERQCALLVARTARW